MSHKTFQDIAFITHPSPNHIGVQGILDFENGYGISVISTTSRDGGRYGGSYGGLGLFEIGLRKNGSFCGDSIGQFDHGIVGWCDEQDVTEIIKFVQYL
jgi:hypothetical protein